MPPAVAMIHPPIVADSIHIAAIANLLPVT
jgi:hypothetical protein